MIIIIKDTDQWSYEDWDKKEQFIGVKNRFDIDHPHYMAYEVLDKHLFMLAVIKYNIEFEEI